MATYLWDPTSLVWYDVNYKNNGPPYNVHQVIRRENNIGKMHVERALQIRMWGMTMEKVSPVASHYVGLDLGHHSLEMIGFLKTQILQGNNEYYIFIFYQTVEI